MSWFSSNVFKINRKKSVEPASFTCRISDKSILEEFDEMARKGGYNRNEFLNIVLERFVKETRLEIVDEEVEEELSERFEVLETLLKKFMNRRIRLALTRDDLGMERNSYILVDNSVTFKDKKITINVIDDKTYYTKTFDKIYDIAFNENDVHYKVWIYMEDITWRFYLIK